LIIIVIVELNRSLEDSLVVNSADVDAALQDEIVAEDQHRQVHGTGALVPA
jgi:hypothetical protein